MSRSGSGKGLLAAGNWIIDRVKMIDQYPSQDALASILGETSSNGGCAYNLLKNLALLEAPFPLKGLGLVGDDKLGQEIIKDCRAHGIDAALIKITTEAPTSYTDVMTVESTGRRTFFHQRGANAFLDEAHFDFSRIQADHFHLGYLMLLDSLDVPGDDGFTGAARVLKKAQEAGMTTSVDLVSVEDASFGEIVGGVLPFVDIFIANEIEAAQVLGIPQGQLSTRNTEKLAHTVRGLKKRGVRHWVAIHDAHGCIACDENGKIYRQSTIKLPPDLICGTAGAGDAFSAGLLFGFLTAMDLQASLNLAVCAGAMSLQDARTSAAMRPRKECLNLVRQYGYLND